MFYVIPGPFLVIGLNDVQLWEVWVQILHAGIYWVPQHARVQVYSLICLTLFLTLDTT
jgi:hypothetical protein